MCRFLLYLWAVVVELRLKYALMKGYFALRLRYKATDSLVNGADGDTPLAAAHEN